MRNLVVLCSLFVTCYAYSKDVDGVPGMITDRPDAAYVYTFLYGISVSESIGVYAELYGDLPENNGANHFWNSGITDLIQNNIQLDASIGQGITTAQDILVSAGASFRLPK